MPVDLRVMTQPPRRIALAVCQHRFERLVTREQCQRLGPAVIVDEVEIAHRGEGFGKIGESVPPEFLVGEVVIRRGRELVGDCGETPPDADPAQHVGSDTRHQLVVDDVERMVVDEHGEQRGVRQQKFVGAAPLAVGG